MMALTLIGERLNLNREPFRASLAARNAAEVLAEARRQIDFGATHLDLNPAHENSGGELGELLWMLETILPTLPPHVGIALDTVRGDCLAGALKLLSGRPGTLINTSSAAPADAAAAVKRCADLAAENDAGIIALLAHAGEVPGAAFDRLTRAEELHRAFLSAGIPTERQYFDPQVLPLAFDPALPRVLLETLSKLRANFQGVHLAAGLSNISFNLPARSLLNRTFLAMLLASGADTLLCDPCSKAFARTLAASRALLGKDDFLADYLGRVGE